jgi:hypothetical protein
LLAGESNSIKFDVSPQFFDCGMQPYDRMVDKEFFINNSGKVSERGACTGIGPAADDSLALCCRRWHLISVST